MDSEKCLQGQHFGPTRTEMAETILKLPRRVQQTDMASTATEHLQKYKLQYCQAIGWPGSSTMAH